MKLTIITPVFRFDNLFEVAKTIPDNVRWLCVADNNEFQKDWRTKPAILNAEFKFGDFEKGNWGVAKVNHALNFVQDGHVYILDDDTILHPNFDMIINLHERYDFIHFNQETPNGVFRVGGTVKAYKIDIGNFVVSRALIGDTYLKNGKTPDGVWAEELHAKSENAIYINKTFSFYNYLR